MKLLAAFTYVMRCLSPGAQVPQRRIVRLDLDETLICQIWMKTGDLQIGVVDWQIFIGATDWCYYRIRPSALSLIEALRSHGCMVEIQTRKAERSAERFLEAAGIRELFDAVYGKDSDMTPPDCPWVLVDDLEPTHQYARNKLLQARGWDRYAREFADPAVSEALVALHYVQCHPYTPSIPNPGEEQPDLHIEVASPLTDLLPEILAKLAAQR